MTLVQMAYTLPFIRDLVYTHASVQGWRWTWKEFHVFVSLGCATLELFLWKEFMPTHIPIHETFFFFLSHFWVPGPPVVCLDGQAQGIWDLSSRAVFRFFLFGWLRDYDGHGVFRHIKTAWILGHGAGWLRLWIVDSSTVDSFISLCVCVQYNLLTM